MPRLTPQSKRLVSAVSVLVLFLLALLTNGDASAQRRRRPVQKAPQQQGATNTNTTAPTGQAKSQKKNITPLRGGDTADGSRLTITSDVPLNDYSAYRSGDRYYVEIPDANAPRAASGLRGRGFEDVQVQKRGDNAVISFKLQPGATARVSQKFNRLDVELSAPGRGNTATTNPTPTPATVQPTPRSTPQTPTATQTPTAAGQGNQTQPGITGVNTTPSTIPPGAETIPPTTFTQPPDASASPGVSPEASPLATPPSDVVAQTQPQPETQPITQPASGAPSSSLGATLARNWMLILIVGLVLASLVLVVAARSRARGSAAATPVRRVTRKERRAARAVASEKLSETTSTEDAAAAKSAIVLKPGTLPKAVKVEKVEEKPAAAAVVAAEETKEVEPITTVDAERLELEVKNLLSGESYDEALIGSTEAETRQLVATELLSALASRNPERRERARTAFVKHDYLDEATRNLRTAGAAAERASAARALGYVADKATTPHLIAALEDEAPEVRRAAVESLAEMGDASAAEPLQSLLKRERDKKVPLSLIERAISASTAVVEVEETVAPTSAQAVSVQEETTLETAPVINETDKPPVVQKMGLVSEAATTAVLEEEEVVTEVPEVEPSVSAITAAELAEAASQRETEEEAERLRAEEEERQRLEAEAEARRAAEEEEFRREAARLEQEEREQAEREEQERLEAEARRKAEEEEASRLKAEEEEARLRAEEEARLRAEEEVRLAAEAEAARIRVEEEAEAKRKAEEQERRRAEEEQRLAAEAAAAEEARLRAEAEERRRAEEEERRAKEKARLVAAAEAQRKAQEEARARRQAEEEAERAAEAEARRKAEEEAEAARLRAEEEAARLKAEEEARLKAEEEARLKAEAEAEAQRKAEEEAAEAQREAEEEAERLRAEENARRLAAEEAAAALQAEIIPPVEHDIAEPVAASSQALPFEPAIETNEGLAEGWVEVDVAEPEVAQQAEPAQAEAIFVEPSLESPVVVEEPTPAPVTKEIEYAVTETGVDIFDENTTVPRAILRRLSSEEPDERASAVIDLARVGGDDSFREINAAFDDPAIEVRNAAARSLFNVDTDRAATFTRALREAPPERRRKIGAALASSGLASEAIGQLMGESREKTYDAFSLLFLMSKAGEVQPLMRAIEEHPNNEVRLAVIKLLALSGQQEILPAFRRLAVRGSLPTEVRSAVMEAIYQLSSQSPTAA